MRRLITSLTLLVAVCAVVSVGVLMPPSLCPASDGPRSQREYRQALRNVQANLAASDEAVFTRTGRMDKQPMRYFSNPIESFTE